MNVVPNAPEAAPKLSPACEACPSRRTALRRLGVQLSDADFVVALAGNPNTGKSTVFNALTGLRQHTGNWPGKTIARAEGAFAFRDKRYRLVDLPGTYSLLSASADEEVTRNFILFGRPDVTVVVLDATALERNLNLMLQVLQISDRVVVALNLIDEARAHRVEIDVRQLARELGVPVVPCAARQGEGLPELLEAIAQVATGETKCRPPALRLAMPELEAALGTLAGRLAETFPGLPQREWIALRMLAGDRGVLAAAADGRLAALATGGDEALADVTAHGREEAEEKLTPAVAALLADIERRRWRLPPNLHDTLAESIYGQAGRIADACVRREGQSARLVWQSRVDRWLTGAWTGFPLMLLLFSVVLWLTISGANVPSGWLATLLVDHGHTWLRGALEAIHLPAWGVGLLADGVYLATAWVVSVMLPPMAIFFPVFTLLEDLGYLPRVSFNLDRLFQAAGAHGKQSLTLAMGYGCNAAGVVAARIIDSPRERLIAIVTNNFALCNGRWPTQIMLATVFIGALAPQRWSGLVAALTVAGIMMLGFFLSLGTSWLLSRTALRGEASFFNLELPPYRPPQVLRTLYTSLIDRTLFVLWRAVVFAAPAGAAIWLVANVHVAEKPIALWFIEALDPLGVALGLNGVILLAYVVAIPANEIVIPTVLMLTSLVTGAAGAGVGVMFDAEGGALRGILEAGGWTTLTAVCLMLFSLCHNPCSTTLWTIYKETRSAKWTAVSALLPIVIGMALCSLVALVWRSVAGG
ncbi:MAG TPA: ferrous iron transport protein B [Opitutaceae bacterium]|nr:ferrous iron transport protein B [Opitutaceae bacterium]